MRIRYIDRRRAVGFITSADACAFLTAVDGNVSVGDIDRTEGLRLIARADTCAVFSACYV